MAATRKKTRYVHSDLIREIFLYLPCKSLIRFKSDCKLFNSFLHDLQFMEEHRKLNMKPSHYLTWDTTNKTKLHVFSLSSDKYSHVKTISTYKYRFALPSSYGLICLYGWDSKSIALFNPVSEKIISLPDLPSPFAFETKNKPGAPIPTTWYINYLGFGFDLKTQTYKIVQFIIGLRNLCVSECYVLTVLNNDSSTWRRIDVSNKSTVHFLWQPIYADGVLYWENVTPFVDIFIEVLAFDLSTEKMNVFDSPTKYRFDGFGNGKHLTSLEGKLCCVELTPPVDMSLTMTIWKLNASGIDWMLWYKLEIYNSRSEISTLYPLYIDGKKRIICQGWGDLYCYSIENKSLEIYPVSEKVEGVGCYMYTNLSIIHSDTIPPVQ